MANPYDQFDSGNPYDAFDAPPAPQPQPRRNELARQLGLAGRAVVEATAALPVAAADFGVGVRNLVTGSKYESPSTLLAQTLDKIYGKRETGLEQVVGVASNALIGAKMPLPLGNAPRQVDQAHKVIEASRAAGYVVPPATANPTAANRTLEGLAGKIPTAMWASAKNQGVTTGLAKKALGLPDEVQLTPEVTREIRQQAVKNYDEIRAAGAIVRDSQFTGDLARIAAKYRGASKDYPELAKSDVDDLVAAIDKDSVDANSAVDAIRILRERADDAFSSGKGSLGKAAKTAADSIESLIERNLLKQGKPAAEILAKFRDERKLIAKTYTVDKALNPSTGNVSAIKLGQQLQKGKPLSGDLRLAAQFGQAAPKAAREFNESLPGVSPLDFYMSGGLAAAAREPIWLLYPLARQALRRGLLSPVGQTLSTPGALDDITPGLLKATATGAEAARKRK